MPMLFPGALARSSSTPTIHEAEGDFDLRPSTNVPWVWTRKYLQQTGAAANITVWDPAAGAAIYLHKIIVTTSANADIQITEGADAAGTRLLDIFAPANGGAVIEFPHEAPYKCAADAIIKLTSDAGNAKVQLWGFEK